jgi:acetylornithine deacetylase/succinyl-diaminopimelate desuccinylase-like protein
LPRVRAILDALAARTRRFVATAPPMFSRPAYEVPRGHEIPKALADALTRAGGARRTSRRQLLDRRRRPRACRNPVVLFGPGGAGLHSTEEYVTVQDVSLCRDALVN